VVPALVEGTPHAKPMDETAAHFIVRMVHQYPGEVVIWAGGPMTNIALALRLDPEVATLAKELVLMGSGMYANNGGINSIDGRREFNWWFDPEAVRIAMRAPWMKITITPIDISVKTTVNPDLKAAIAKADTPVARYLAEYSVESFMWDELSAAALIDPSIVTGQKELYVDIDVDHGPSYGETLFWDPGTKLPPYERKATVQFDVDTKRLYDLYIKLMTLPQRTKQ
jgi:inosine-uridine nucleoside N-ribohydrolase